MIAETELLEHALIGLEARRRELDERIAETRRLINDHARTRARRKRHLTAEGRANIVAALKRRWAEHGRRQQSRGPR